VAEPGPHDLEVLFRVAQTVHAGFRQASTSPHRADVVAMGADGSPTEEVDRVAEAQILAALDAEGVDWDVLSEEAGLVRRGGGRVLVVDPIDGSHNVFRNLPFSTVSLALGTTDLAGVDVGLVRDLHLGTTYWAARGEGAWRDGRPMRVRPWVARGEVLFVNLGAHASERAFRFSLSRKSLRVLARQKF